MKKFYATLGIFALIFASCTTGTDKGPIKIGYIGPQTGDAATIGADMLYGTQMAVDEINATGGINGREIQLIVEDGRCSGSESASATQKLISINKVVAIIGGQCSSETLAAAPIAEDAQVVLMSPVSSSPDVTSAGDFTFRSYSSDDFKGKAFASLFTSREFKKIAFISENTDFCQGMVTSVKKYLPAGVKIVFEEFVDPGTKDYRSLMTRLQNVDFDVFIANAQSPVTGAEMLKQFRELGLEQIILGTDAMDSNSLFEIAENSLENFFVISIPVFDEDRPFAQSVLNVYKPQFGIGYIAHSYDATKIILNAIEEVGTNGPDIRDFLYNMPEYNGEVGTFHFDKNGDAIGIPFALKGFQNGKFVKIADIAVE